MGKASESLTMGGDYGAILHPAVKHYPWGSVGSKSLVARLWQDGYRGLETQNGDLEDAKNEKTANELSESKPYAELWIGAHVNGMNTVAATIVGHCVPVGLSLDKYLTMNTVKEHLPGFLLKVLACESPLSIQVHPESLAASELHRRAPHTYVDDRGKDEICIALGKFELFCGALNYTAIRQLLVSSRHLLALLPQEIIGELDSNVETDVTGKTKFVKQYTQALLSTDSESLNRHLSHLRCGHNDGKQHQGSCLCDNVPTGNGAEDDQQVLPNIEDVESMVLKLGETYPGDPGVLAPYFLQYHCLENEQAIYIQTSQIHSYIRGTCIECLVSSDNVVRGGLTGKSKDLTLFMQLSNLDGNRVRPMKPKALGQNCSVYSPVGNPPFVVYVIKLSQENPGINLSTGNTTTVFVLVLDCPTSVDLRLVTDTKSTRLCQGMAICLGNLECRIYIERMSVCNDAAKCVTSTFEATAVLASQVPVTISSQITP